MACESPPARSLAVRAAASAVSPRRRASSSAHFQMETQVPVRGPDRCGSAARNHPTARSTRATCAWLIRFLRVAAQYGLHDGRHPVPRLLFSPARAPAGGEGVEARLAVGVGGAPRAAQEARCSSRISAGYSVPMLSCRAPLDTCSSRAAIAYPWSGPSESRVCSTIRSSVPWRTSALPEPVLDTPMEYHQLR